MRKTKKKKTSSKQRSLQHGYRSGLEVKVADQIESNGFSVVYEDPQSRITYQKKASTYTPDFILANGIIIETKGRFLGSDRTKHLLIQKQHPEKDIRFVFSNSRQKLSKGSKTTYAEWCEKKGFKWADAFIPDEWFNE